MADDAPPTKEGTREVSVEGTTLKVSQKEVKQIKSQMSSIGPATILVFILHGAGPGSPGREDRHLDFFRENTPLLMEEAFPDLLKLSALRIEYECVDWRTDMHNSFPQMDQSLEAVRIDGIPTVRQFLDSHLPDVLLIAEHGRRDEVLRIIHRNLNAAFCTWRAAHSERRNVFVMLVTHCLASLIAHALLGRPDLKLDFPVAALFTMGTPFGWFFPIDGYTTGKMPYVFADRPGCPYFYNVVHPYDPLAARFEPFVNAELARKPPVNLLYWKTEGSLALSRGSTAAASAAGFVLGLAFAPLLSIPIAAIGGIIAYRSGKTVERVAGSIGGPKCWTTGRYDFQLQTEPTEEVSAHMAMISAHHNYWVNKDVLFFMLTQMYRIVFLNTTLGLVAERPPEEPAQLPRPPAAPQPAVQKLPVGPAMSTLAAAWDAYAHLLQVVRETGSGLWFWLGLQVAVVYSICCVVASLYARGAL
eukprot:GGOE01003129.1.p1 GENE.GGOE01003129.1~~GGOE01003129.1.p1  ORF type:complete len:485 (-),score=102.13 GGOE01003129.1:837-2255(-)